MKKSSSEPHLSDFLSAGIKPLLPVTDFHLFGDDLKRKKLNLTLRVVEGSTPFQTLKAFITLDDSGKSVYLLPNEGENCLLFSLTDADGIQDLTSCFYNFTSPGLVHEFAGLLELLRSQGEASFPTFR